MPAGLRPADGLNQLRALLGIPHDSISSKAALAEILLRWIGRRPNVQSVAARSDVQDGCSYLRNGKVHRVMEYEIRTRCGAMGSSSWCWAEVYLGVTLFYRTGDHVGHGFGPESKARTEALAAISSAHLANGKAFSLRFVGGFDVISEVVADREEPPLTNADTADFAREDAR